MLEMVLMIAGIPIESPTTNSWKRTIPRISNVISALQLALTIGQFDGNADVLVVAWYLLRILGLGSCFVKFLMLNHFAEKIREVQNFIVNRPCDSGDNQHDASIREKFGKSVKRILVAIMTMVAMDMVVISIPSSQRTKLLGIPTYFLKFGSFCYKSVQFLYGFFIPLIWIPMYLSYPLVLGMLLTGLRTEMQILKHSFEHLGHQTKSGLFDKRHWLQLKHDIGGLLNQQLLLHRHLRTVRHLVGFGFFIAYYFAVFFIGAILFITKMHDIAFFVVFLISLFMVVLIECYCWCHLVDSLDDVADGIGQSIYELCAKLPDSREHHSDFVAMRTSLMIIWMNTCNSPQVKCLGIFRICSEKFVNLCNASYTVFTFFIGMPS
ncbi:AAEL017537-PA [Aedes aegypti]|uniref:Odorant receptor 123 n=2 Tax=Aedes aegypti TaxID=7159 RepID=J9EA84_AEDAE|nr:AAEL017537-PA [Aedes aegypti]DAA80448.1 TPA_exp: odorant receptor 123 [Aedes aegypti]